MAADLRSILEALHAPLDAAEEGRCRGEIVWSPAPKELVHQLREVVMLDLDAGGYGLQQQRAIEARRVALYQSERPKDALEWLIRTQMCAREVKAERKKVLELIADHARLEGPSSIFAKRARDVLFSLCRDDGSGEEVRGAAYGALRAVVKRDDCREGGWARDAGREFRASLNVTSVTKRLGGVARAECMKLLAAMVSYYVDNDDAKEVNDYHAASDAELAVMPWSEAGNDVFYSALAALRQLREPQAVLAASFAAFERLACRTRRYIPDATKNAGLVASKLISVLVKYTGGEYHHYELPAKALRCLARCAEIIGVEAAKAASAGVRAAHQVEAKDLFVLLLSAASPSTTESSSVHLHGKISKHAPSALEACCRVLSKSEGVGRDSLLMEIEARLTAASSLENMRWTASAALELGAAAAAHLTGELGHRVFNTLRELTIRCDELDKLAEQQHSHRNLTAAAHTLEARAGALRCASSLSRGDARRLAATTPLAVRCACAHASQLSINALSARTKAAMEAAFVEFFEACAMTQGGEAAGRVASRAAVVAAATRHGGGVARLNPETGDYDDRVCFETAKHWRGVARRTNVAYGSLVSVAFSDELLDGLNLDYDMPHRSVDIIQVPTPRNPYDHELLINLASFLANLHSCKLIVDVATNYWAERPEWAIESCRRLVLLSRDKIHVSALYRLVSIATLAVDGAGLARSSTTLYRLLRTYVADAACLAPSFVDDDLLSAASELALGAPFSFQDGQLDRLAGCARAALRCSRLRTARLAMETLEAWGRKAPTALVDYVLPAVLPELDKYARALTSSTDAHAGAGTVRFVSERARRRDARRQAALLAAEQTVTDAAASELARRAIRLLGSLGSENARLVGDMRRTLANSVAWATHAISDASTTTGTLLLDVQAFILDDDEGGEKRTLELRLDAVAPRLAELATAAGVRDIRILAAEALHACILHAVGRISGSLGTTSAGLEPLFEHVLSAVISLAADDDPVLRSLFGIADSVPGQTKSGLLMQLAHWLGWSPCQPQIRTISRIFVDALLDCVVDDSFESPGPKRKVAAAALAEFVKSLAKHQRSTMSSESAAGDDLLGPIFSRVLADVNDSRCSAKRRGGVLAVRNLVQHLRNEPRLLSRFGLALLKGTLCAIRRSSQVLRSKFSSHVDREAIQDASRAADEICDIVIYRVRDKGDEANLTLGTPVRMHRFAPHSISALLEWIWQEGVGDVNHSFRRRCWRTLSRLAPLIAKSLAAFVHAKLLEDDDVGMNFMKVFDKHGADGHNCSFSLFSLSGLACLNATLHAYAEFVRGRLLPVELALRQCRSRVFGRLSSFLIELKLAWTSDKPMPPDEGDEIKKERCYVAWRGAKLLSALLEHAPESTVAAIHSTDLWNDDVLEAWLRCLVAPQRNSVMQSAAENADVEVKLRDAVADLLQRADLIDDDDNAGGVGRYRRFERIVRDVLVRQIPSAWRPAYGALHDIVIEHADYALPTNVNDDDADADILLDGASRLYTALCAADKLEDAIGGAKQVRELAVRVGRAFFAEFRLFPWRRSHGRKALSLALNTLGLRVVSAESPNLLDILFEDDERHAGQPGGAYDNCAPYIHRALVDDLDVWRIAAPILTRRVPSSPLAARVLRGALEYGLSARKTKNAALLSPIDIDEANAFFAVASPLDLVELALRCSNAASRSNVCAAALEAVIDAFGRGEPAEAQRATRLLPLFARTRRTRHPLGALHVEDVNEETHYERVMEAIKKRIDSCFPTKWFEYVDAATDDRTRKQRAFDGQLKALCDAYAATAAPELLDLLIRQLNQLDGNRPHHRSWWLHSALRRAGRRARATVVFDVLRRLGFFQGLEKAGADLESPTDVYHVFFSPPHRSKIKLPKLKPALRRALVEDMLYHALIGSSDSARASTKQTIVEVAACHDMSRGAVVLEIAITAVGSGYDVFAVHAAAIILQAALDPSLGESGDELARRFANQSDAASAKKALRKRVLETALGRLRKEESKLRNHGSIGLTMDDWKEPSHHQATTVQLTRDDRAALCAVLRLYVTVGVASQTNHELVAKICFCPHAVSVWRMCAGSNLLQGDRRSRHLSRGTLLEEPQPGGLDAANDGRGGQRARLEAYRLTVAGAYTRETLLGDKPDDEIKRTNPVSTQALPDSPYGDTAGLSTNARKMLAGSSLGATLDHVPACQVKARGSIDDYDEDDEVLSIRPADRRQLDHNMNTDSKGERKSDVSLCREEGSRVALFVLGDLDLEQFRNTTNVDTDEPDLYCSLENIRDIDDAVYGKKPPSSAYVITRHPCMRPIVDGMKTLAQNSEEGMQWLDMFKAHLCTSKCLTDPSIAQPTIVKQVARNTTIFALQAAVNAADDLAPYAKFLRDEMVDAALRTLASQPYGVMGIDFLLRDVVTILTSETWRPAGDWRPSEPEIYRKLAAELTRLSHYHAADDRARSASASGARVTDDNVSLVYTFTVVFANALFDRQKGDAPFFEQPVLHLLKFGEVDSSFTSDSQSPRRNFNAESRRKSSQSAGLALVRSVLSAAVESGYVDVVLQETLFTAMLDCFADRTNQSDVYTLAADVVGDMLKVWRDSQKGYGQTRSSHFDTADTKVIVAFDLAITQKLRSLKADKTQASYNRIVAMLISATRADPCNFPSGEWHINFGLWQIASFDSKQRADILDAITAASVDKFDDTDIFDMLLRERIDTLLSDSHKKQQGRYERNNVRDARPIVQIKLYQLLQKRVATLVHHKLCAAVVYKRPLGLATALPTYRDVELRKVAYKLLMALHDLYYPRTTTRSAVAPPDMETAFEVRRLLLAGLADPDVDSMHDLEQAAPAEAGVRRRVYDYWRSRLASEPQRRFDCLLSEIFVGGAEACPHRFAASVLLVPAAAGVQWKKPLHTSPLDERIAEQAVSLDLDQALLGTSFVGPLFSLEAQLDLERRGRPISSVQIGNTIASLAPLYHNRMILATQSSSQTHFSSLGDPRADGRAPTLASDLLLPNVPEIHSVRSLHDPQNSSATGQAVITDEEPPVVPATHRLRKRVRFTDPPKYLADIETRKRKRQRAMYRTYKASELPDIQITMADVMRPLSALALRDGEVGSSLFEQLFVQLYERRSAARRDECSHAIERALRSHEATAEVVSALHRACVNAALRCGVVPRLNTSIIAESAARTGVYEAAAILVELVIVSGDRDLTDLAEMRRLYSAYGDVDAELAVCDILFENHAEARLALEAEGRGDYRRSVELYTRDLETHVGVQGPAADAAKRVVEARCMRIALELGDWSLALDVCLASAGAEDEDGMLRRCMLAAEDDDRESFDAAETLRVYATTVAHAPPPGRRDEATEVRRQRFLDKVRTDHFVHRAVEANSPCSLALALLAEEEDTANARISLDAGYQTVAASWALLHRCAFEARSDCLREMVRLAEIDACLDVCLDGEYMMSPRLPSVFGTLLERWATMPLGAADPAVHWMRSARSRASCAFMLWSRKTVNKDAAARAEAVADKSAMKQHLVHLQLDMMRFAIDRGDLEVARAIESASADIVSEEFVSLRSQLSLAIARRLVTGRNRDPANCRAHFEAALADSDSLNPVTRATAMAEFAAATRAGASLSRRDGSSADDVDIEAARQMLAQSSTSPAASLALAEFVDAVDREQRLAVADFVAAEEMGDSAHAACVACAIRHYLRALATDANPGVTSSAMNRAVPRLVLRLSANDNAEAVAAFRAETEANPAAFAGALVDWAWRFVAMATNLRDSKLRDAVYPVVSALSTQYPTRVRDAVRFAIDLGDKPTAQKLAHLCRDELAECFAVALDGLVDPELRARDALSELAKACHAHDKEKAAIVWKRLRTGVFASTREGVGTAIGERNRNFAKFWGEEILRCPDVAERLAACKRRYPEIRFAADKSRYPKLVEIARRVATAEFGVAGDGWESGGVLVQSSEEAQKAIFSLVTAFDEFARHGALSRSDLDLKLFSQYLRDFDGVDDSKAVLGVPGGDGTTILSFDSRLIAINSLRRPKKLTVRCSDGVDRAFLVKGGEDLRNDDRVETAFAYVNRAFAKTPRVQPIRTYRVFPLTPYLGLVEWIEAVATLADLARRRLGKERFEAAAAAAHRERNAALHMSDDRLQSYHASAFRADRATASTAFDSARASIRSRRADGYIRYHVLALSPRPEVYVALRASYTASLAASSAATYIVGLGDRHPGNLMLDNADCSLVHIDLGLSFGGGHHLGIPELVPFRLTPELVALLSPLDADLLERPLARALTSLRSPSALPALEAVLDAFASDPLVDWTGTKAAKRQYHDKAEHKQSADEEEKAQWRPLFTSQFRVQQAADRLRGVHPTHILFKDLECNAYVHQFNSFDDIKAALSHHAPAADTTPELLTPEQQARILINLATDPSVLARQYRGLDAWW